jgi:hypothetical protein
MTLRTGLATVAAAVTFILIGAVQQPAVASTSSDADAAVQAVISQFWDPAVNYFYTNSDHTVHSAHAYGPDGGLYSDFWWEAQMWEMVMDAYQRTGNATYRTMIYRVLPDGHKRLQRRHGMVGARVRSRVPDHR